MLTLERSEVCKTESKGTVHKHHIIVAKVVFYVVTANNSHVAIHVYWN